jgi:hypothetical protein
VLSDFSQVCAGHLLYLLNERLSLKRTLLYLKYQLGFPSPSPSHWPFLNLPLHLGHYRQHGNLLLWLLFVLHKDYLVSKDVILIRDCILFTLLQIPLFKPRCLLLLLLLLLQYCSRVIRQLVSNHWCVIMLLRLLQFHLLFMELFLLVNSLLL